MIPRIIHYVWVGPAPLPAQDAAFIRGWKQLMPGWQFRFWNDTTIDFASSSWLQAAYAMKGWNRISDYVRLWSVMSEGGIYLDTDIELLKPLDPLLSHDAFIGYQMDDRHRDRLGGDEWVNSAVFGAAQGHWFPATALALLTAGAGGWKDQGAWTGPGVATKVLVERGLAAPLRHAATPIDVTGMAVYPRQWFHPYHWSEQPTEAEVTAETVGIHHWSGTWTAEAKHWPLRKKLLMRCARIAPRLTYTLRRRQLDRTRARHDGVTQHA